MWDKVDSVKHNIYALSPGLLFVTKLIFFSLSPLLPKLKMLDTQRTLIFLFPSWPRPTCIHAYTHTHTLSPLSRLIHACGEPWAFDPNTDSRPTRELENKTVRRIDVSCLEKRNINPGFISGWFTHGQTNTRSPTSAIQRQRKRKKTGWTRERWRA